jgi:predicted nucleic acid-binding protein
MLTLVFSSLLFREFHQSASEQTTFSANNLLNSSDREFLSSQFVKLEVLPKAVYHQQQDEVEFYETFFDAVTYWATDIERVTQDADQLACTYGLAAMDALHVAAALLLKADELITTEKPTKPMHRVTGIRIISI